MKFLKALIKISFWVDFTRTKRVWLNFIRRSKGTNELSKIRRGGNFRKNIFIVDSEFNQKESYYFMAPRYRVILMKNPSFLEGVSPKNNITFYDLANIVKNRTTILGAWEGEKKRSRIKVEHTHSGKTANKRRDKLLWFFLSLALTRTQLFPDKGNRWSPSLSLSLFLLLLPSHLCNPDFTSVKHTYHAVFFFISFQRCALFSLHFTFFY